MNDIGRHALKACVWEATARKPGNVHRFADFDDLTYLDFMLSAAVAAPELALAPRRPVGETILATVEATQTVTETNTNLGIVLLLAPLAAVDDVADLITFRKSVERVVRGLTVEDAKLAYRAIRLAQPGGLGDVPEADVSEEPTVTLREAMSLAADRDTIARQYDNGFRDVFESAAELPELLDRHGRLEPVIIDCHLRWLARFPDSLIARKFGPEVAGEVSKAAAEVLAGTRDRGQFHAELRSASPRRNPGTTADLVAATLFVALRLGLLPENGTW